MPVDATDGYGRAEIRAQHWSLPIDPTEFARERAWRLVVQLYGFPAELLMPGEQPVRPASDYRSGGTVHDQHGYTTPMADAMHWTAPAGDAEVPGWLA